MSDDTTPQTAGVTAETPAPEAVNPETPSQEVVASIDGAPPEASDKAAEASPDTSEKETPPEEKKRGSASERIRQLNERTKAAEAKSKALEARLAALTSPGVPAPDQYDDTAAYNRDLAIHAARAAQAESVKFDIEQSKAEAAELVSEQWAAKAQEASERWPDFKEVISNPSLLITDKLRDVIVASDVGTEVAYYLGKHPEEAAKISRTTDPVAFGIAFGRVEALAKSATATPQKKVSSAPPPAPTVSGGAATAPRRIEELPMEDFAKALLKKVYR